MQNLKPDCDAKYLDKSSHYFHGMKSLSGDISKHRTSISLLAVHSAISLSDAIVAGVTGKRGKHQDHRQTIIELGKICRGKKISDGKGMSHLQWLRAKKTAIAYGPDPVADASIKSAIDHAERLSAWAYNHFELNSSVFAKIDKFTATRHPNIEIRP